MESTACSCESLRVCGMSECGTCGLAGPRTPCGCLGCRAALQWLESWHDLDAFEALYIFTRVTTQFVRPNAGARAVFGRKTTDYIMLVISSYTRRSLRYHVAEIHSAEHSGGDTYLQHPTTDGVDQ